MPSRTYQIRAGTVTRPYEIHMRSRTPLTLNRTPMGTVTPPLQGRFHS